MTCLVQKLRHRRYNAEEPWEPPEIPHLDRLKIPQPPPRAFGQKERPVRYTVPRSGCRSSSARISKPFSQNLVEGFGFTHRYNSIKRSDVLDSAAGDEAQLDFGKGDSMRYHNGKFRTP